MDYILCTIVLVIGITIGFFFDKLVQRKSEGYSEPCPHGYENWDDCPDCCH